MKKIFFAFFLLTLIVIMANLFVNIMYPVKYSSIIDKYCQKYNVEQNLIYAMIKCESNFKEDAVSNSGACGLMQIMPSTMKYIMGNENKENNLFDPEYNIETGIKYLRYLLNKFENLMVVLCAYNAGEGNVYMWLKDEAFSKDNKTLISTPFNETNNYVKKVLNASKVYKNLLN